MTKGEIAENYFRQGYNCAQSVALAYCEEMNMDKDTVSKLTNGFGAGMGRLREVCGSVSGMTFVISALYGDKSRAEVYELVQKAAKEFEKENGSIVCRELLGLSFKGADVPVPEKRTTEYYKKRPCAELVHMSADILSDLLTKIN